MSHLHRNRSSRYIAYSTSFRLFGTNLHAITLVLGLGPGLKDSLKIGDKSLVLALTLRLYYIVLGIVLEIRQWRVMTFSACYDASIALS